MAKVTGSALTPTANKVIEVAQTQIGYHEGRSGSTWNNIQKFSPAVPGLEWSQGQAWCATFVSWVAMIAKVAGLFPRTASTDTAASWYQSRKRWSEYPAIGAQGFLAHGSDEFHTFLVTAYDDDYIWTIEGNSNTNGSPQGDGVYALKRRRRDAVVEGYGYPKYPEGIISADPAWAPEHPKKTGATVSTGKKKLTTAQKATALVVAFIAAAVVPVVAATRDHDKPGGDKIIAAQTLTVVVQNEKSFPPMPKKNYQQDFNKSLRLGGKKVVWLLSEISYGPEVTVFKNITKRLGIQTRGVKVKGDTAIATKGIGAIAGRRVQTAVSPAGPSSPARWITVAAQKSMPVVYIALHLINGCFAKNAHKSWYKARCKALNQQIALVKKLVVKFRKAGAAVVVGGDMNKKARIIWGAGQKSASGGGMIQLAAFGSSTVKVKMTGSKRLGGYHTDHPLLQGTFKMTATK